MKPEQWLLDETRQWTARAGRDLALARRVAGEFPAESLFHCQQAAEKWLKAFLTWHQVAFRKTHELRELGRACCQIDGTLADLLEPAYLLSSYAWRFRYPGAPYEPTEEEANEAIALAEGARAAILARLPEGTSKADD
jgi:HEPN domain-containing protein